MRTSTRILISLLVAAVLVAVLMAWGDVDLGELARTWAAIPAADLGLAFALYAVQYALRAWRFHVLVPAEQRPSYVCSLSVTAAYGMATLIVPAKLGEATYVLYLNRAGGVPALTALASLVVGRLLDLATLLLGFGLAALAVGIEGTTPLAGSTGLGLALVLAGAGGILLAARGDLLVALVRWCAAHTGLERFERGRRLVARCNELGAALRASARGGRLLGAVLLSLPMWACVFAFCAVLAHGFGLPREIGFAEASIGASLAILSSALPLSAFANFGTLEVGWVFGFGLFGVSRELALATGTGLHLAQLAFALALGLAGHLGMGLSRRGTAPGTPGTSGTAG